MRAGAILGFGHVAANGHLPAWCARRDARIVAVADVDPTRRILAETLLPGVRVYEDATALLAREQVDFVDIATPPHQHRALIEKAIAAGCHVLCEKPLVTSLADLHRVEQRARETGVTVVTVHNWKQAQPFKQVAALLAGGVVGRLARVEFSIERNGRAPSVGISWRRHAAQAGGGILFDHGWHAMYLALTLAREVPLRIRATIDHCRPDGSIGEDTAHCTLWFPSTTVAMRFTWAAAERRTHWTIAGDRGAVEVVDDRLTVRTASGREEALVTESPSAGSHHPDWFDAVIDSFFAAADDPTQRFANLAEATWCLTLITLAHRSAASGVVMPVVPHAPMLPAGRLPGTTDHGIVTAQTCATEPQS